MAAVLGLIIGVVIGVFVQPDIPVELHVFLGNQLGVGSQLQTAVIVVLGIRIFTNVSSLRRFIFKG